MTNIETLICVSSWSITCPALTILVIIGDAGGTLIWWSLKLTDDSHFGIHLIIAGGGEEEVVNDLGFCASQIWAHYPHLLQTFCQIWFPHQNLKQIWASFNMHYLKWFLYWFGHLTTLNTYYFSQNLCASLEIIHHPPKIYIYIYIFVNSPLVHLYLNSRMLSHGVDVSDRTQQATTQN